MIYSFYFNGQKLTVGVNKVNSFEKYIGLMFKSSETENLLFEFKKNVNLPIHSFFVFFPFLAVWLDDENKVIEFKIVRPFCFSVKPNNKFRRLIEVPINIKNKRIVSHFCKNI